MNMTRKIISAVMTAVLMFVCVPVTAYADWDEENGNKVYVSEDGGRLTGFQIINEKKYYFDKDGYMVTGWVKISGNKYYFSSDGVMRTGWLSMKNGKRYYLDDNGIMLTGLQTISGKKYYFSMDGVMKTGWLETTSGNKYYFKKDGTMAKNCSLKINGTTYSFDENGKAKTVYKMNTVPKDFVTPSFGTVKSKVLQSCGIANYKDSDKTKNTIYGEVIFGGIESDVFLSFNSDDELYLYAIFTPCSYSYYYGALSALKEELGYEYTYDNGRYTWDMGTVALSIKYVDLSYVMISAVDFKYMD